MIGANRAHFEAVVDNYPHRVITYLKTYGKMVYEKCQHAVSIYQCVTHTITMAIYKIISLEHIYIYIYIIIIIIIIIIITIYIII